MNEPSKGTISVIIPAYNVESYIRRCIESVLKQTYSNFEIIVVDDGSKDGTAQIIREYQERDSRVKGVFKQNGGVTTARNRGLALAKGDYLFFLDGDDYIPLSALADLYNNAIIHGSDIVFGLFVLERNGKRIIYDVENFGRVSSMEYLKLLMTGRAPWQLCSKLIKRTLYQSGEMDDIPADLAVGEDALMLFHFVGKAQIVSMVNNTVYYYVQRGNSVMHSASPKLANDNMRASRLIIEYIEKRGLATQLSLYCLSLRLLFLLMAFQKGKLQVNREYVQPVLNEYKEHKEVLRLFRFYKRIKIQVVINIYKWF